MRIIGLLFAAMVLAGTAQAQSTPNQSTPNRHSREGFWISFGLGGGSAGADCTLCGSDRTTGPAGYIRLGGTISQKILLGFESQGWSHSESGFDELMGTGAFVMLWYPASAPFYIKLGVGGTTYKADDGVDKLTATAPSGGLGVGYEIRVGRSVSVNPFFNTMLTSSVSAKFNGVSIPTGSISLNQVQLGVGLTLH